MRAKLGCATFLLVAVCGCSYSSRIEFEEPAASHVSQRPAARVAGAGVGLPGEPALFFKFGDPAPGALCYAPEQGLRGSFGGRLAEGYSLWFLVEHSTGWCVAQPQILLDDKTQTWRSALPLPAVGRWQIHLCLSNKKVSNWLAQHASPAPGTPSLPAGVVVLDSLALTRARRPLPLEQDFVGSGYMGDLIRGDGVKFTANTSDFHSAPSCYCFEVNPDEFQSGWLGFAFQHPANSWGDEPGLDLSGTGFTELRFFAKSSVPDIQLQVCTGGMTPQGARYHASYSIRRVIKLTGEWEQYSIPLRDEFTGEAADLSNVVSAFAVIVNRQLCPVASTIYVDSIEFHSVGE